MRVEVLLQQIEYLDEHRVAEGEVDLVADLSADDNLLCPQDGQVLGQVRGLHVQLPQQGARADFAISQCLDNRDTGGMRECLEDLGLEGPQRGVHVDIYIRYFELSQLLHQSPSRSEDASFRVRRDAVNPPPALSLQEPGGFPGFHETVADCISGGKRRCDSDL